MPKKYLPSKKLVIVTLISFAIIGLIFFFIGLKKKNEIAPQNDVQNIKGQSITVKDIVEKDTDSDTVPDWEEVLWGTDPSKTDTNGDGVADNVEIEKKKQALAHENTSAETENSNADLNETEKFSREFFASIIALQQSGNLNDQTVGELANTVKENAALEQNIPDSYSMADIKTEEDSKESIRTYHEQLLNVLNKYKDTNIGEELSIIDASLSTEDKKSLEDLYGIALEYKNMADDFAKIKTPSSIASTHLNLVNSSKNTGLAIENAVQIYDNSIKGLIGISQYKKESDMFDKSFVELQDYFKNNGIIK